MADLLKSIDNREIEEGLVLWWLGGPSWVLKTPTALLYIDLFTGPAPTETLMPISKGYDDLVSPGEISSADLVLSTHYHLDHCHKESLVPIYNNTGAIFVGPASSVRLFKEWGFAESRFIEMVPQQKVTKSGVSISALPSKDCDDKTAVSYIIQTDDITLFESGDSLYFEGFKDIGKVFDIDIALINFMTNPPEVDMQQFMNPPEVAQTAHDLRASIMIPKHWDIWTEMFADPEIIREFLDASLVSYTILEHGEEFAYQK